MAAKTVEQQMAIASGASTGVEFDLSLGLPCSISIPASLANLTTITFTRTTIAGFVTTLTNVATGSAGALADFVVTLTASKTIPLPQDVFKGIKSFKIQGGTLASPQAANADITFVINYVEAD